MQRNDQAGLQAQIAQLMQQLNAGQQQAPQQPLGMLQSQYAPIAPGAQGNAPNAPNAPEQSWWDNPDVRAGAGAIGGMFGDIAAGPGTNIPASLTKHYNESRQMQDANKLRQGNQQLQDFLKQNPNADPSKIYRAMIQSGNPDLVSKGVTGLAALQKSQKSGGYAPTEIMKNLMAAGIKPGSEEWNDRINQHLDGKPRGVGAQSLNAMRNSIKKENPEWDKEKVDNAFNAYLNNEDTFQNGEKLPPLSGEAKSYFNLALKSEDTAKGLNSARAARVFDKTWKSGQKLMPNVVKFSGPRGAVRLIWEKGKSALGSSSPEYKDYRNFAKITAPALANAAITAEGANMSDQTKKTMMDSVSAAAWDADPEAAMAAYNYLGELYAQYISPAVASSPSDVKQQIARGERESIQNQKSGSPMVTITNKKTGEQKSVSLEEARRLGVPNV